MARFYSTYVGLPCSKKDFEALMMVVYADRVDNKTELKKLLDEHDDYKHIGGLVFRHDGKRLRIITVHGEEEGAFFDELPEDALPKLGSLIKKAGMDFLALGYAELEDGWFDDAAEGTGGGAIRILPDGSIKEAKLAFIDAADLLLKKPNTA